MKKAEPREKDAALAARQQAEERDVMRQRRIRNRKLLETEEPVVLYPTTEVIAAISSEANKLLKEQYGFEIPLPEK